MTTQTLNRLRQLKLSAMASALEQQLQQVSTFVALPFIERLSLLIEHEHLIGDNTLADAILDRLMHTAHNLKLKDESMRKNLGQLTEHEHLQ